MNTNNNIDPLLIKIATPEKKGTGIVLADYGLIITALHNIFGYKEVLISGMRFPRMIAKVLFTDRANSLALIEAPVGVIFPQIKISTKYSFQPYQDIFAAQSIFGEAPQYIKGKIYQAGLPMINPYIFTTKHFKNINKGSVIFDEKDQLIGIHTTIAEEHKLNFAIKSNGIINTIEEFIKIDREIGTRCFSCKKAAPLSSIKNLNCPHCGKEYDKDLIIGRKPTLNSTVLKIEEIIKKLNYELAISRIGKNYWEIEEGSTLIRITYHEDTGFIKANAVLCKLPGKDLSNIYEYLLMENNYLKGLSFSIQEKNIILAITQIHESDLHIKTAVKLFKYLFYKADDYDDTLIEMGAIPLQNE